MTTKEMTQRVEKNVSTQRNAQEDSRQTIQPPVDILENSDEYLVLADLPGVRSEDVNIELNNGELSIRAPATFGFGIDLFSGGNTGYEYGRRFRVPAGIQGDKVAAELKNGVLKLRIPKEEAKKPRQIPVAAS